MPFFSLYEHKAHTWYTHTHTDVHANFMIIKLNKSKATKNKAFLQKLSHHSKIKKLLEIHTVRQNMS